MSEGARLKQDGNVPAKRLTVPFGLALDRLLPAPVSRETLLALFGDRATFAAIQSWRFGHVQAPQWAIDTIIQEARKRFETTIEPVKKLEPRRHQGSKNLAAWRAQKLLVRC